MILPRTVLSESAKESIRRHVWIIDILIAILLLLIASQIQTVLLLITGFIHSLIAPPFGKMTYSISEILNDGSDITVFLQLVLTVITIFVCIFYCIVIERRSIKSIGFCGSLPVVEYFGGFIIGTGVFALARYVCILWGAAKAGPVSSEFSPLLILFLFGFMIQGLSEEVLCRGFLMQTLSNRYSPLLAVILNSLFFAVLHLANPGISVIAFINLFLFGVFASLYYWKRGSIWGIAAVHSAWNFAQGNLFGIKVSGIQSGPSVFNTVIFDSDEMINGGLFGLEGGLSVTLVLTLAILAFLFIPVKEDVRLEENIF